MSTLPPVWSSVSVRALCAAQLRKKKSSVSQDILPLIFSCVRLYSKPFFNSPPTSYDYQQGSIASFCRVLALACVPSSENGKQQQQQQQQPQSSSGTTSGESAGHPADDGDAFCRSIFVEAGTCILVLNGNSSRVYGSSLMALQLYYIILLSYELLLLSNDVMKW